MEILYTELHEKDRKFSIISKEILNQDAIIKRIFSNYNKHSLYYQWTTKVVKSLRTIQIKINTKQNKKLIKLGMPIGQFQPGKTVYNFSSKMLTENQLELLSKGTDYILNGKKSDKFEIFVQTERLFKDINYHNTLINSNHSSSELKQHLRKATLNYVYQHQSKDSNISQSENEALIELTNNNSISIVKADKVKAFVILDKTQYNQKGFEFLNTPQFTNLPTDDSAETLTEFQKLLAKLKRKKEINGNEYDRLKPLTFKSANAYFLPKIHKPRALYNLKVRPIVSCFESFLNNASKFLSQILQKSLLTEFNKPQLNSFQIVNQLKELKMSENLRFIGFDIENLYPSIPLDETIEIAINLINKHKFTSISKENLKILFEFCTKRLSFQFEGKYYQQQNGVPMGSPLAPILAETFLQTLENNKIKSEFENKHIKKYWRFVDDGLLVIENSQNKTILENWLQTLHPNIKFTFEEEINNQIHFLDINIKRFTNHVETRIYRKPCHPLLFQKWTSNLAYKYKISIIRNLFNRTLRLSSTLQIQKEECKILRNCLLNSGYPINLINKIERQSFTQANSAPPSAQKKTIFFGLPYIGKSTEILGKSVQKLINKHGPNSAQLKIYYKSNAPLSMKFQRKAKPTKMEPSRISNCVYKINCKNCDKCYVGETGRQLSIRIKEHMSYKPGTNSATINSHASQSQHQIDFTNVEVLRFEKDPIKRKLFESLYMSKYKLMDGNQRSVELNLFQ